jgi:hypothetical protein
MKVGGNQGLYQLRHLSDGGGVREPTERCALQGGNPTGLELGPVGLKLPSPGEVPPRRHGIDRGRGSLKTRPIKSVPSRVSEGQDEVGSGGRGWGKSDSAN